MTSGSSHSIRLHDEQSLNDGPGMEPDHEESEVMCEFRDAMPISAQESDEATREEAEDVPPPPLPGGWTRRRLGSREEAHDGFIEPDEVDDMAEDEEYEPQRPLRDPGMHKQWEINEHNLTHINFRP